MGALTAELHLHPPESRPAEAATDPVGRWRGWARLVGGKLEAAPGCEAHQASAIRPEPDRGHVATAADADGGSSEAKAAEAKGRGRERQVRLGLSPVHGASRAAV